MQFKFKPLIFDGKPKVCWVVVPFRFRFNSPDKDH